MAAVLCSTLFLAGVPVTAYAGLIVWSGDIGGPLNLIIIPLGSLILGGVVTLVVYLPLGLVSERLGVLAMLRLSAWTCVMLLMAAGGCWLIESVSGIVSRWFVIIFGMTLLLAFSLFGFISYLCCLAYCRKAPRGSAA